jgi:hypothetical protein
MKGAGLHSAPCTFAARGFYMRQHVRLIIALISMAALAAASALSADTEWTMAGANPQRTSHNDVEVRGNLSIDWYRVIDPFVDSKVQVVAAAGKIFLSTSRGLVAFDAATGNQLWFYRTELPPGHSPTYFNGVIYLGCFDHRIHALDATTGQRKAGWPSAEAKAGFETNPLVISDSHTGNQPMVLAGNRDGYFYAYDGTSAALKWSFKTSGPIRFSAAYRNGVAYFASDDSHAYALNVSNGSLIWKSARLPGAGFSAYWPVIYTDNYSGSRTYGKDFILVTASKKASSYGWWGANTDYFEENRELSSLGGCTAADFQPYLWNSVTTVLSCGAMDTYFNATRPDRRNLFVLEASNGVEQLPYPPMNWAGASHGGNKYPPVVGADGVLYTHIGYLPAGNSYASGYISGWKFGTNYISKIWNGTGAADEPPAFTSGGNLIYWGEGVNSHAWGTVDITRAVGSNSYSWQDPRSVPGAGSKYFFNPSAPNLWLASIFGSSVNGIYSYYDGVTNQSPIPYNGRLYLVNANVLFALSPGGKGRRLADVSAPAAPAPAACTLSPADIKQLLESEIQKILAAGHLRPGFYNFGYVSRFLGSNFYPNTTAAPKELVVAGDRLTDYFHTPGETLYTLSSALPHIDPALGNQLKDYLKREQANYPVQTYAHIGWQEGTRREAYPDTPEITSNIGMGNNPALPTGKRTSLFYPSCCVTWVNIGDFPADAFYGAWRYAQSVLTAGEAKTLFDSMKGKLQNTSGNDLANDSYFVYWPYLLNQYIAGYRGYLELEKLAGYTSSITQSSQYAEYQRLLNLRILQFSKDSPYDFSKVSVSEYSHNKAFNIARNFMFLTPELAEALRANRLTSVREALSEYTALAPFWFVPKYERTYEEGVGHHLYDRWALFQAKARILKEPFSELVKYIDAPAFEQGDLYYIQNLVAALEAAANTQLDGPSNLRLQ